jgi:F-type H+-transporting ATPase subunit b
MLTFAAVIAAAGEAKSGLPQLNVNDFSPQLIWLAITFGLLYVVLSRVALPRIGEVIEERRDRIQRDLDAAERLKSETEKAIAAYEQSLGDARSRASAMAKDTRDKLAAESAAERGRLEADMAAKAAAAEARIADTKSKALAGVDDVAADVAAAVIQKVIGQPADAADIRAALASTTDGQR